MSSALAMFRNKTSPGDIKKSAQKVSDHKKDSITRLKHLRLVIGAEIISVFLAENNWIIRAKSQKSDILYN